MATLRLTTPDPSSLGGDIVLSFGQQLVLGLVVALSAAILAVIGNWLVQLSQMRAGLRAELRAFVRQLHAETVATVSDLDLFVRDLRSSAVAGTAEVPGRGVPVRDHVKATWEGGLLRRVRELHFGHPDPDVRDAAEQVEDAMWPYIVAAEAPLERGGQLGAMTYEDRRNDIAYMENSMRELKAAVWAAPRRDVPRRASYTGAARASYLWRSLVGRQPDGTSKK